MVVKITVLFWVLSFVRYLEFWGPSEGTIILTTTHMFPKGFERPPEHGLHEPSLSILKDADAAAAAKEARDLRPNVVAGRSHLEAHSG